MTHDHDGDPQSSSTVIVGIIGSILLLAIIVFAQALFYNAQRFEESRKALPGAPPELTDLQARQLGEINAYHYVNKAAGIVAVPIDRAIELYVTELKTGNLPATMRATAPDPGPSSPANQQSEGDG